MRLFLALLVVFAVAFSGCAATDDGVPSESSTTAASPPAAPPASPPASPPPATPPPAPQPKTWDVDIKSFAYAPSSLNIRVGDTVRWTNMDGSTHTATSDPGAAESFDTGNLGGSASGSHKFTTAGTVGYHCTLHGSMKATLTVTA